MSSSRTAAHTVREKREGGRRDAGSDVRDGAWEGGGGGRWREGEGLGDGGRGRGWEMEGREGVGDGGRGGVCEMEEGRG